MKDRMASDRGRIKQMPWCSHDKSFLHCEDPGFQF